MYPGSVCPRSLPGEFVARVYDKPGGPGGPGALGGLCGSARWVAEPRSTSAAFRRAALYQS